MDRTMTKAEAISLPGIDSDGSVSFEGLYEMYRLHVYRFARALTNDASEAEDLFQETWLRVARAFGRRPEGRDFRAWIFTITANLHKDAMRKKKVRRIFWLEKTGSSPTLLNGRSAGREIPGAATGDPSAGTEFQMCLRVAIASLPPRQRKVFLLKEIEGYKHSEIGTILKIPENTVRTLLHRAVKTLQRELREFSPAGTAERVTFEARQGGEMDEKKEGRP